MTESATEKMRRLHSDKMLTVDEMEDITGGTAEEWADDSRFLNVLLGGHVVDRWGPKYAADHISEITFAWQEVGVVAMTAESGTEGVGNDHGHNQYFINGKKVTHEQARQHAMKVTGKYLKPSDWNW